MAAQTAPTKSIAPDLPPDESVWQRYSPHFEMPLAGATSVFLHGTVIGMLVMVTVFSLFAAAEEASKPANMDVVMIEGEGSGFEGLGGEAGLPALPTRAATSSRTEFITPDANSKQPEFERPRPSNDPPVQLALPILADNTTPNSSELTIELEKLAKAADDQVKKAMQIPTTPVPATNRKKVGPLGSGNPKGVGGLGGSGSGIGKGNKQGAGIGTGGFGGRKATQAEIFASRWHFDVTGDPKEHAPSLLQWASLSPSPIPKAAFSSSPI